MGRGPHRGPGQKPFCLLIEDSLVSLSAAGDLWGLDTYDTIDALKGRYPGESSVKVLAIGPAGEHLVKYASVCHDKAHHLGRTGMGAVMGSKNLKAVAVRGSGKVPIAAEEAFAAARSGALQAVKESMMADSFHQLGTAAAMDLGMMTGDVPLKNWSLGARR